MNKYDIETLVLYLEKKLPKEQADEISSQIMQNADFLERVLEISKIASSEINIDNPQVGLKPVKRTKNKFRGVFCTYVFDGLEVHIVVSETMISVYCDAPVCGSNLSPVQSVKKGGRYYILGRNEVLKLQF